MPRVTVCLAVFNGAETLPETLESVQAQTYRDFEVFVLDDGSSDESAAIARAFGCTVVSQPNEGLGAARKRMVAEAAGELVAFVDADDTWTPEKLERQVALLDASGAALVHSDCWYVYEDGREVPRDLRLPVSAQAFDHIIPSNLVIASSALFRRQAMLDVGNFVEDTIRCSDWYGWFLLASRYAFAHLPEKQVRYKVLSSSLANAGYRFHEAQRYVLRAHILPRFDELFARTTAAEKAVYRKLLMRSLGLASSSMAKHLDRLGQKMEARPLHLEALRLSPGTLRVWTRLLKNLSPLKKKA